MDRYEEIAQQAAKAQAAGRRVLELSKGMKPHDYTHPNYRALQTAIRAFKREDGRLTRLKAYWEGQDLLAALEWEEG